ncbi:MAG: ABC transporter substrate-binding protein [candidate division NC10 bacterium]|nr:ABC transporter substrate-binding protein [candidate division NC10 bacterium]
MLLFRAMLALAVLAAAGGQAAAEPTRVRVAQAGESLLFLPATVASALGYFQEAGLEVTPVVAGGGGAEVRALLAGRADFAIAGGPEHLAALERGAKLLAVASLGDRLAMGVAIHLEVAQARGITAESPVAERLKALKGLTVGASGVGALSWLVAEDLLRRAGYTPGQDVTMLAAGAGPVLLAALEQRKVDVLVEAIPVPETAVDRGAAVLLVNLARGEDPELGEFLLASLLVRPDFAGREPDTVRRTVRALLRGSRFIADRSPEEIVAVLEGTGLNKFPRGVLQAAVTSLKGAFPPHGRLSQRALDVTQRLLREAGRLRRSFTLLEVYTPAFLP